MTTQGKEITVLYLDIKDEDHVLNQWAEHIRNHYCTLDELDALRTGFGMSRTEFLRDIKFPNPAIALGAATMSGDFSEILIADYVEYILKYTVPRVRYRNKFNRNTSTQGSDLIGYKLISIDKINKNDEMIVFEVKAKNSEGNPQPTLQNAVDHSMKDIIRIAESLNASYQILKNYNDIQNASIVRRFQNPTDHPYKRTFAAAAVVSDTAFSRNILKVVDISNHPSEDVVLLAVHSPHFLEFIKQMYARAANVNP